MLVFPTNLQWVPINVMAVKGISASVHSVFGSTRNYDKYNFKRVYKLTLIKMHISIFDKGASISARFLYPAKIVFG